MIELYGCRAIQLTALDTSRTLVTTLAGRERVIIDAGAAALASRCTQFATLDDHAAAAGGERDATMQVLRDLADGGLLVSKQAFLDAIRDVLPDSEPSSPMRTIGIPTCDRAVALELAVDGYLANASKYGHVARAIVCDDGDPASARRTRDVLTKLARRHDREIRHAGPAEKRAFLGRLERVTQIERSVLEHALFGLPNAGPTFGGNRNALYLAAGERYFSADDDTVAEITVPCDREAGVELSAAHDPTWVRLHRSGIGERAQLDLLALHDRVLGRRVADVLPASSTDVTFEGDRALMSLLEHGDARIRASWMGIAGEAGVRFAAYYLYRPQTDRSAIATDDDYRRHCRQRLVLRAPRRMIIGTGAYCQATAVALDGSTLLPPWIPTERGEDVVFGAVMRSISPRSLTAYHPCAVTHAPLERAATLVGDLVMQPGHHVAYYMLVLVALAGFAPPPDAFDDARRLEALGRHFRALGATSPGELAELLRDGHDSMIGSHVRELEHHLLQDTDGLPQLYRDELRTLIELTITQLESEQIVAKDFVNGRSEAEAFAAMQRQLAAYGEICLAWPTMVVAARALTADDAGLGTRV